MAVEVFDWSPLSPPDSTPDGVMKGEEDEGFDEEFCDSEDPPLRTVPDMPPLSLKELSDLHTLLADSSLADSAVPPFPTATLFDDIDPGVYMLEAENSTHSMLDSEPGKSPLHSPFPVSAPSPVCAGMSLTDSAAVTMSVDEWNITSCQPTFTDVHGHYPPASSVGGGSGYGSPVDMCAPPRYLLPPPSPSSPSPLSATSCNYDLDVLVSMCHQSSNQPPISAQPASPVPQQLYQQPSLCNMTFGDHLSPSSPCQPASSPVPCGPPLLPSTCPYTTPQSRPATQTKGCSGGTGPNSTPHGTRTDGSMSCTTEALSSTPDHTPNTLCSTAPLTESSEESDIPKKKPSIASDRIVNMPFYQLKKILDSPTVPEEKKSDIKNIRRRGKNKIAAKTCRQRKMNLVLGLQQEIEQLQALKLQMSNRTNSLQREIEALKTRCLVSQRHRQHMC